MIKKKKISKKKDQMGERKILPKVSATENKSKIDIKNEIGQISTHLVDLREKEKIEAETPFFWLNAPKKSIWRQNFLERMKKMDKPEDFKDSDEIVPLLETKNESDFVEKESKRDITQKEEVPRIVMKLVASNHTWAHQGWEKIETVLVGWTDKSLVRAFLLFFLVCWMIILPVKIITSNSGQKVFGEKIFNNSESSLDQESKIKNLEEDKRFLLIFQSQGINRGKIEGLSLVDVSAGKIKKVDNLGRDFETLNKNLKLNLIPPEPLKLIEQRWNLETANWWSDFPSSAKKIAWFYENSGGATVDGVFNFYGSETSDFSNLENTPWVDFWDKLTQKAQDKQAQIYFSEDTWQKMVLEKDWAGEIKNFSGDYLMLVNNNFNPSSTENLIKKVELESEIQSDQSLINTLTLYLNSEIKNTTGTDEFWNYLRIYVPAGINFISSEGFSNFNQSTFLKSEFDLQEDVDLKNTETEIYFNSDGTRIYRESGKTVLANWIKLTESDNQKIILKYQVPGNFSADYKLYWQKQLGAPIFELKGSLIGSDGTKLRQYESKGDTKDEVLDGVN